MKKPENLFDEATLSQSLAELLVPPTQPPPQLMRERILGSVARPRLRYAPFYDALGALFDLNDSQLSDVFERSADHHEWSEAPIAGTSLLHFRGGPRSAQADNGLVRVRAGSAFPTHRHLGLERVVVLEGGYRDLPSQRVYRPGDWHEMAAFTEHAYVALEGSDLLLAVSLWHGIELSGSEAGPGGRLAIPSS